MPERSKRIAVNINALYAGTKPSQKNLDEYYRKVNNQLPSETKNCNIVLTGTAPIWLILEVYKYLMPFVDKISIITKNFEYEVYNSDRSIRATTPRRIL